MTDNSPATETVTERMIQALHAGISQRSWSDVENAANIIRDAVHVSRIRAETAKNSGEVVNGAPERICVAQDSDGFWTCREAVLGSQEYVRADIERDWRYEALRLKALLATPANSTTENSGEAVAWQRKSPNDEWGWVEVRPEDIAHYKSMGQEIRPLYATPANSRAEAIRECIAVVEAMKETHSGIDDVTVRLRALLQQEGE